MNSLYTHEKKDKVKWIITFVALGLICVFLVSLSIGLLTSKNNNVTTDKEQSSDSDIVEQEGDLVAIDGEGNKLYSNQLYEMPSLLYLQKNDNLVESGMIAELEIFANVQPENATNKQVDYSLSWDVNTIDSELAPEEFVLIEQLEDGSQTAIIKVIREFPNSSIILTVTTRDGGFTASCTLLYLGTANSIEITSGELTKGDINGLPYYKLLPNRTYEFDINLETIGGFDAKKFDLDFAVNASNQWFFVGDCFVDPTSGITTYDDESFVLLQIEHMLPKLIEKIWIEENKLYVTMGEVSIETYYSSSEEEYMVGVNVYEKFVSNMDISHGEYFESYSSQNLANIQDAHIQIIVVDKISNIGYSFYIYHGSDSILNNWSNDIWDET